MGGYGVLVREARGCAGDAAWKTGPAAKSAAQIARKKVFDAGMGVRGFEEMCGYGWLAREARECTRGCCVENWPCCQINGPNCTGESFRCGEGFLGV